MTELGDRRPTFPPTGSSWLFVPGDRPDRFDKAAASGAHHVIIDLEDAVAVEAKDEARAATVDWLRQGGRAWVRVGAVGDASHVEDLQALRAVSNDANGLQGVMLPKATPASIGSTEDGLGHHVAILALVETAAGIRDVHDIAANPAVVGLALGTVDLALELSAERTWDALLHARGALVVAARASGLPGPLDGPSLALRTPEEAGTEAEAVRGLGFGGKLCVHPAQVPGVNAAFAPTVSELAWARQIASVVGGPDALVASAPSDLGLAAQVDGEMVDRPVLLRARHLLVTAATTTSLTDSSVTTS